MSKLSKPKKKIPLPSCASDKPVATFDDASKKLYFKRVIKKAHEKRKAFVKKHN